MSAEVDFVPDVEALTKDIDGPVAAHAILSSDTSTPKVNNTAKIWGPKLNEKYVPNPSHISIVTPRIQKCPDQGLAEPTWRGAPACLGIHEMFLDEGRRCEESEAGAWTDDLNQGERLSRGYILCQEEDTANL